MEITNKKPKYPLPYNPPQGCSISYVSSDDVYILEARAYAYENSLDKVMPNASVLVLDGSIIGRGANGSDYHDLHGCDRVKQNIPTGEGYDLCEGCHPKNHGEPKAIADAKNNGHDVSGGEIYLWGHWWCCEDCWNVMISNGVHKVYLLDGSEILFNKNDPDNVVGRQFD